MQFGVNVFDDNACELKEWGIHEKLQTSHLSNKQGHFSLSYFQFTHISSLSLLFWKYFHLSHCFHSLVLSRTVYIAFRLF